jgi:hypothetical protein
MRMGELAAVQVILALGCTRIRNRQNSGWRSRDFMLLKMEW